MSIENLEFTGLPAAIDTATTETSTTVPDKGVHERLGDAFVDPFRNSGTELATIGLGVLFVVAAVVGRWHMNHED
jgi:hypothetical protein